MIFRFLLFSLLSLTNIQCANNVTGYDAIVDQQLQHLNELPRGKFKTIQAALDAAPSFSSRPYRIFIKPGQYFEKIIISKPNIKLVGSDKNASRIFYNAYAGQQSTDVGATSGQIWGTSGSATIIIRAVKVELHHLTIENSFDFLSNDKLDANSPKRITHTQAVALHLDKGSDEFIARDIRILGYQDTVFINSGRSWFDKSVIAGNVDFIFGSGNSVFTESEIKTLSRGKSDLPAGYLVAPSTNINQEFGFTFINCRLTREPSVPDNSTYLGRPWHPTTQFSDGRYADPNAIGKAVFINTWMDAHIANDGWQSMSGTAKDGTKVPFLPEDARFFEYNSHGPGAQINYKRRQLNDDEAKKYSFKNIIGDWKI